MSALRDAVLAATADTPYTVDDRADGFVVHLDLADARWFGLLSRSGLRSTFSWEVREEPGGYSITDVERRVEGTVGVSGASAGVTLRRGRIITKRVERIWGLDDAGRVSAVVDYRLDSSEGRDLVRTCAERLGLRERLPRAARIGLYAGIAAAAFAVVLAVVLVVVLVVL